jgi:DNA primase
MYIDFKELKARVSIADVAALLDLTLSDRNDELRGPCPHCREGGDRALIVTPAKQVFYCFAAEQGGDCIALVAHIKQCSMREAAIFIHTGLRAGDGHVHDGAGHVPVKDDTEHAPETAAAQPALKPLSYLIYEHESVQALGLDEKTAEALGIGYAKKGIMRGRVAIPLRRHDGTLVGYCGYAPSSDLPLKFPSNLTGA